VVVIEAQTRRDRGELHKPEHAGPLDRAAHAAGLDGIEVVIAQHLQVPLGTDPTPKPATGL
jgi:hypothetical protein